MTVIYAVGGDDLINFSHPDYNYGDIIIYGGDGNDFISGGSDSDILSGGQGA